MTSYETRYVGVSSLPNRLSDFDLQHYFQLTVADIAALKEAFRVDRRAGAAVLLLFLRVAGRPLDQLASIPRSLLRYVGEALTVKTPTIASLRALYKRSQTFYAHQLWVKEYLGLKDVDQATSDQLAAYLGGHANEVVSIDELVTSARHWLFERQVLIPSDRAVRDLARKCYDAVEKAIYATIVSAVPASTLAHCRNVVYEPVPGGAATVLEWLKTPPKRHSPSTLAETLDKIAFLKQLGVHEWPLDSIPLEKQRGYAQQIQARRPAKSKELKDTAATIEVVCFLRTEV